MCDIICVTNRRLCKEDFLLRIEEIAKNRPAAIILREKDLSESDYKILAEKVLNICKKYNVSCILHNFINSATQLKSDAIHLPLPLLRKMSDNEKSKFKIIGASCHSVEDAVEAQTLGCTYITAGHIFQTDCKKGVPPRGIDFLRSVCKSVSVPVYAIGGIDENNIFKVINTGAKGACVMSGLMQSENIVAFMQALKEGGNNENKS